jgi:hypothetical protein
VRGWRVRPRFVNQGPRPGPGHLTPGRAAGNSSRRAFQYTYEYMFKHIINKIILLAMAGPFISVYLEFVSKTIIESGNIAAKNSRWLRLRRQLDRTKSNVKCLYLNMLTDISSK